jgi:hypothetical protein
MASTRNINTKEDYTLEQRMNKHILDQRLFLNYGENPSPAHFDIGMTPSQMFAGHLSSNYIDVESTLRGIRSTNLEGSSFNETPKYKKLETNQFFERTPMIMPDNLIHYNNERPNYLS